mgnify:CR=1 FL=1
MINDRRLGYRDVVQTLYYHEIAQHDDNLTVINNIMEEGEEFATWEEFLEQPQEPW